MFNLGIARASIFSYKNSTIISEFREEHFIDIKSGEIKTNLVLNDCSKKQYFEVIVFKDKYRKKMFPATQNFQPICCTEKMKDCKPGVIKISPNFNNYKRYIIRPTCTLKDFKIPKKLKKRPFFEFQNSTNFPIHNLNDTFKIDGSDMYAMLLANCSPDNISVSGTISLETDKKEHLDNRIAKIAKYDTIGLFLTLLALMKSLFLMMKKNPVLENTQKILILSAFCGIIGYCAQIAFFFIWNLNGQQIMYLELAYSVLTSVSRSILAFLTLKGLQEPKEVKSNSFILVSVLLFIGFLTDKVGLTKMHEMQTSYWGLGYGKPTGMIFFSLVVVYGTIFYIVIENKSVQESNINNNKSSFITKCLVVYALYIIATFAVFFASLDLDFIEGRFVYEIGTIIEPFAFILIFIANTRFWVAQNKEGWQSLDTQNETNQDKECDISLVGNGELKHKKKGKRVKVNFINAEEESEDEESISNDEKLLNELQPIETV